MTVPSSKSLSINAACSFQYGCSRLVFPALQAGPGEKKVAKVFFIVALSVLCVRVLFYLNQRTCGYAIHCLKPHRSRWVHRRMVCADEIPAEALRDEEL